MFYIRVGERYFFMLSLPWNLVVHEFVARPCTQHVGCPSHMWERYAEGPEKKKEQTLQERIE
jgi:hypothetical protein